MQLLWGGAASPGRAERLDPAPGHRNRDRRNEGPGRPRRPASEVTQDGPAVGAGRARIDARHGRPRPGASAQGAALVPHLQPSRSRPTYTFHNPDPEARDASRPLPAARRGRALRRLRVRARTAGRSAPASDVSKEMTADGDGRAGRARHPGRAVPVARARAPGPTRSPRDGVAQVRDFTLTMRTNFADDRLPRRHRLAERRRRRRRTAGRSTWTFANLISGQAIGMELPEKLNPGPFAARVTFFAPVSLLFFLAVMVMVGTTSGTVAASDALLVHRGRVLRLPPAARLSRRPRDGACRIRHGRGRQPRAGRELPARGDRHASAPCSRAGSAQARLSRALQLRVLLRGLHRTDDHDRRHRHALRPDADDGTRVVGRGVRRRREPGPHGGAHASRG